MSKPPFTGEAPPPVVQRPRCPACDKPLRPRLDRNVRLVRTVRVRSDNEIARMQAQAKAFKREIEVEREVVSLSEVTDSISWNGKYHGYGAFCTLRCCDDFANAAYQAGYRRKFK